MKQRAWWVIPLAVSLNSCNHQLVPPVASEAPSDPVAEHPFDEALDVDGNTFGILAEGDLSIAGTAVDSQLATLPKERMVDRVLTTAWSNGGYRNATSWASLQLAASTAIASVSLKTGPSPAGTSYDVQVSPDGVNWTTKLANQTNTTWNMEIKPLPAGTSAKFVRIFWRNSPTNPQPHFSIYEITLRGGTDSSPSPSPTPSTTPSPSPSTTPSPAPSGSFSQYYPNLTAVAPRSYYLDKGQPGKHLLRFSTAIANTGPGHLQVRGTIEGDLTRGTQEILDPSGRIVQTKDVGLFELHPDHGHFHVANVARYELRQGTNTGPVVRNGFKVSFCMEDSYRYMSSSEVARYPDCTQTFMGVTRSFADLYSAGLPDQLIDITGLPAGEYTVMIYLDPHSKFLETSRANNTAWMRVRYDPSAGSVYRTASFP